MKLAVFWFRRDYRLDDNIGLYYALKSGQPVLPIFIFDENILDPLPKDDSRVNFIHQSLSDINENLSKAETGLLVKHGDPIEIWKGLIEEYEISSVYTNHDYEPYAIQRDGQVEELLKQNGISFHTFKDQVIFEKNEVVKDNGAPYTVYTPFKKKWLAHVKPNSFDSVDTMSLLDACVKEKFAMPSLSDIGFEESKIKVKPFNLDAMADYDSHRDIPHKESTSYLSPHLRFGTVSVRRMAKLASEKNETFLSELIWREFFMQILFHFPHVVENSFRKEYDNIQWENNEEHFKKWCQGKTGYPMVDAGMRELNETGYMHNRVRMVVASFLTKHLLIDWRWGEAYFAQKLLDYELSSNNGNWQWAAGTGCDAAPYFRVFNPSAQLEKFDGQQRYVKKWLGSNLAKYPPVVEHKFARERAVARYKEGLGR